MSELPGADLNAAGSVFVWTGRSVRLKGTNIEGTGMLVRVKRIKPNKSLYTAHVLFYYASIFIIVPFNSRLMPFLIYTTMGIMIYIMVTPGAMPTFFRRKPARSNEWKVKSKISLMSQYALSIRLSLLASLVFLISCVLFRFSSRLGITPFIMCAVVFCALMYMALCFYISNSERGDGAVKNIFWTFFKISWLAVSVYCYALARDFFMEVIDIPYEQVISKVTVLGYSIVLFVMSYLAFASFAILIIVFFENKKINFAEKTIRLENYSSAPILVPLFCAWYIFFIIYMVNASSIANYVFNVTIPLDTRTDFFCHNRYMIIDEQPNAVYMTVPRDGYRAFVPVRGSWQTYRLTCITDAPYYSYQPVKLKSDLYLLAKVDSFKLDIENARRNN
ncbi:hypothetical protein FJU30_10845 [Affinibrenneria salicis]|uniref:Uncharacterized protein n=1 Tax=Affinibrenneria salicis TaxID=2590031 RepID=A0A5J5G2E0_9GAMM|nr:hypothetical protein [Affinibrenneria salicis]KAA9000700.1 hypothetical protein FJU30_10845 [Affinibrenneria salicis]